MLSKYFFISIGIFILTLQHQYCKGGTGTAFAINENGYYATCYHVIDGADKIQLAFGNQNKSLIEVTLIAIDKTNDLAILKLAEDLDYKISIPYQIANTIADLGTGVYTLGFPETQLLGEEPKLTNGIISARSGWKDDISVYQTSVSVLEGNSGGALISENGYVIGVLNETFIGGGTNYNYAIKSTLLINLINSASDEIELTKSNLLEGLPLNEQVKKVLPCVAKVIASGNTSYPGITENTYFPTNPKTGEITYNGKISIDGKSRKQLLEDAMSFLTSRFMGIYIKVDSNLIRDSIYVESRTNINSKAGVLLNYCNLNYILSFNISLASRKNELGYELSDFMLLSKNNDKGRIFTSSGQYPSFEKGNIYGFDLRYYYPLQKINNERHLKCFDQLYSLINSSVTELVSNLEYHISR